MMNFLKKIVTPNARRRRIMSGICAAFALVTIFFSSFLLVADADHDCDGTNCSVCQEMQTCVENFQLLGSSPLPDVGRFPEISLVAVETVLCARRAPATTLHALDVRFDE